MPLAAPLRLLFLLLFGLRAQAAEPVVNVCFDETDHTPYAWRDAQHKWRGAALALTRAVLERADLIVEWHPLPWLRCLREVEEFVGQGGAEMVIYASRSPERERHFLFSAPLHRVRGGVWYLRQAGAPRLQQLSDLGNYRLCGQRGFNYSWLTELGVRTIDTGALGLEASFEKLLRGRCQLVLGALEPVRGAAQQKFITLPADAAFMAYPGNRTVTQHALVSRGSARAEALLERFNRALAELEASGEAERIYRGFLPDGRGL